MRPTTIIIALALLAHCTSTKRDSFNMCQTNMFDSIVPTPIDSSHNHKAVRESIIRCPYCSQKNIEGISNYKKFQTFDEFTMNGVGRTIKSPFVYVKMIDENIIHVKLSNNIDSTICYMRKGKYWENIICEELWKASYKCIKNGESAAGGMPARIHQRYIMPDTIVEVSTAIIEDEETSVVFVKTNSKMFTLSSLSFNEASLSIDSICMMCRYYTEKGKRVFLETFHNYRVSQKEKVWTKDSLEYVALQGKYNQAKVVYAYKLNSLGEYGAIPGLDKFTKETYQLISEDEIRKIRERENNKWVFER